MVRVGHWTELGRYTLHNSRLYLNYLTKHGFGGCYLKVLQNRTKMQTKLIRKIQNCQRLALAIDYLRYLSILISVTNTGLSLVIMHEDVIVFWIFWTLTNHNHKGLDIRYLAKSEYQWLVHYHWIHTHAVRLPFQ